MIIEHLLTIIKNNLTETFSEVDSWFDKDEKLRNYKPANGGWTINQILEHISLTSHFLLILIEKGKNKSLQLAINTPDWHNMLMDYTFDNDKLDEISKPGTFNWMRPEHMEPQGEKTLTEVRDLIHRQLKQGMDTLEVLKNGEGILYKTTMTVNKLGKIDVYHYIQFLTNHARRHIAGMKSIEKEFLSINQD
jgi:hypothetical protein